MKSTRLTLEDLVIGYGEQRVAGPLRVTWESGGLHLLLGRNGAGKTTLARTLLGLLPPLAGSLQLTPSGPRTWVPQQMLSFEGAPLRARDVVEMGLWGSAHQTEVLSRKERHDRLEATLQRVGLSDQSEHPFDELSGGQRQRVLIARALVSPARLVVLDEPTAGVDDEARGEIGHLLADLAHDLDQLFLVITHDRHWLSENLASIHRLESDSLQEGLDR